MLSLRARRLRRAERRAAYKEILLERQAATEMPSETYDQSGGDARHHVQQNAQASRACSTCKREAPPHYAASLIMDDRIPPQCTSGCTRAIALEVNRGASRV